MSARVVITMADLEVAVPVDKAREELASAAPSPPRP